MSLTEDAWIAHFSVSEAALAPQTMEVGTSCLEEHNGSTSEGDYPYPFFRKTRQGDTL